MAGSSVGYRAITRGKALSLQEYQHAVHAMLHSCFPKERKLFGFYPVRHAVMLQLRFDGTIGFPGGFVDTEESLEDALRRELSEELGPGASTLDIEESNLVASHVHPDKPLCLHFYCKKIKMNEFIDIEKRSHEGAQHGLETLGIIRCPLYTMRDGIGGLPSFLRNNFIGNAKEQLILGLKQEEILTEEEVCKAVAQSALI